MRNEEFGGRCRGVLIYALFGITNDGTEEEFVKTPRWGVFSMECWRDRFITCQNEFVGAKKF